MRALRGILGFGALLLAGCQFGRVNQGRVIHYDAEKGLITLLQESIDTGTPRHDVLPPLTIRVPADRREMGPAPQAGRLISVDGGNRRLRIFDAAAGNFQIIQYTPLEERRNVSPSDPRVAGRRFPMIDRQKGSITIYSPTERHWIAFAASAEQLALPADTWRAGDDVRYYYKDPGQALRLMNVTRTDVRKQ